MIPALVYSLCAIASTFCAIALLLQFRQSRIRLLFWSGSCFVGLALNNILLALDYFSGPNYDLSIIRTIPALLGLMTMIWAFIWEAL